jgi:hypothetical protein
MHHDRSEGFRVDCVWLINLDRQLFLTSAGKDRRSVSQFFRLEQLFLCPQSYLTNTQLSKLKQKSDIKSLNFPDLIKLI